MTTLAQLENAISELPAGEFQQLAQWMSLRHADVLASDGFEHPALEAELLKALDGPRFVVNEELFDSIRARG